MLIVSCTVGHKVPSSVKKIINLNVNGELEMETLKELSGIIKELPDTAIWVIAIYFFFKVTVVGSIYGVIRLAIIKLHDVLMARKTLPPQQVDIEVLIDGMVISDQKEEFMRQLRRLRGIRTGIHSEYIHKSSVNFLREAIDAQLAKDEAHKK